MKRTLSIFMLACSLSMLSYSQTQKKEVFTFSESDFEFNQRGNGFEITSPKMLLTFESDASKPALPYTIVKVPLDDGMEYKTHTYSYSQSLVRTSFPLNKNTVIPPITVNANTLHSYDAALFQQYTDDVVKFLGVFDKDLVSYASFKVAPFCYNEDTRELFLNDSIEIMVEQNVIPGASQEVQTKSLLHNSPYGDFPTLNDKKCEYLIITNEALKPAFQQLAKWKTLKGIKTEVVTTEDISASCAGTTLQNKIKSYIYNCYDCNRYSFKYVLLGGDIDIVPTQACYAKHIFIDSNNHRQRYETTTPTDWFYGCLSGIEWDRNSNGVYGELEDNISLDNQVVLSRLSVKTPVEATTQIDRIIAYEKHPNLAEWENKILMGCRNYDSSKPGDAKENAESILRSGINPYWNGSVTKFYDGYLDTIPGYSFNEEHLQEQFSRGYNFIHTETHGTERGLRVSNIHTNSSEFYYDTIYAKALVNPRNTIFTTSACHTNAIDYPSGDCFSEVLLKNPSSGMLAYIGNAREGWLANGYTTASMMAILYKKLLSTEMTNQNVEKQHRLGDAYRQAKNEIVPLCNDSMSSWRWMLFSTNMLGDPEMPVYTTTPQKDFDDIEFLYENDEFTIFPAGQTVCYMSRDDNGASLYHTTETEYSIADDDIPIEISFCITGANKIPFLGVHAPIVHLQGERISGDYHVFANKTMIGTHVTNARENGPLVIDSGCTTVKSPKGLVVNNGFEVKKGASFVVEPQ